MFFKKEKQLLAKISSYLDAIDEGKNYFLECILGYVKQACFCPQPELVAKVHRAESRADDIRRSIEYDLYQKALIPESREDVLFLLEAIDAIPNCFQDICYSFECQKMEVPFPLKEELLLFIKKNLEAFAAMRQALSGFFVRKDIIEDIKRTDSLESEADKLGRQLIKQIFELSLDKADKLILKELVERIASLSDRAQDVADRLTIAVIKRRL